MNDPLICPCCQDELLPDKPSLLRHFLDDHPALFLCDFEDCLYHNSNKSVLKNHIRDTHDPKKKCPECVFLYTENTTFVRHRISWHKFIGPVSCKECSKTFANQGDKKKHKCGGKATSAATKQAARTTMFARHGQDHLNPILLEETSETDDEPVASKKKYFQRPCPDCFKIGKQTTGSIQHLPSKKYFCRDHFDLNCALPEHNTTDWKIKKQGPKNYTPCKCWCAVLRADYGFPGKAATCCRICATAGMIANPTRKCIVCSEAPALCGVEMGKTTHCETHMESGETNFVLPDDTRTNQKFCVECWAAYQQGTIRDLDMIRDAVAGPKNMALYCIAHRHNHPDAVTIRRLGKECSACGEHYYSPKFGKLKLCTGCAEEKGIAYRYARTPSANEATSSEDSETEDDDLMDENEIPGQIVFSLSTLQVNCCNYPITEDGFVCGKSAIYNFAGQMRGVRCKHHKDSLMEAVRFKRCISCHVDRATLIAPEDRVEKYCVNCNDILGLQGQYRKPHKCLQCRETAVYGVIEPTHCLVHKEDNMVKVANAPCIVCGSRERLWTQCKLGMPKAVLCHAHAMELRPNVMLKTDHLCNECATPCVAIYQHEGYPTSKCELHKKPGMVGPGIIFISCKIYNCPRTATCGANIYRIRHCEKHKTATETNFVEKECATCHLVNIVGPDHKCASCNDTTFQRIKTQELAVHAELLKLNLTSLLYNRRIRDGGLNLLDQTDHRIFCDKPIIPFELMVETDEHHHTSRMHSSKCDCLETLGYYHCKCEIGRMMEISQAILFQHQHNTVWIRFNPHSSRKNHTGLQDRLKHLMSLVQGLYHGAIKLPKNIMCTVYYLYYPEKRHGVPYFYNTAGQPVD